MNIIDITILLIIGLTALSGYYRGLFLSLFSLIRLFLSIVLSRIVYPYVIDFIRQDTDIYNFIASFLSPKIQNLLNSQSPISADAITHLIIKLFVMILIYSLINSILYLIVIKVDRVFKLPILKTLNKFAGLIFGFLKGVLVVFIIYALLTPVIMLNPESLIAVNTGNSLLAEYFYKPEFLLNLLEDNYFNLIKII